MWPLAPTATTLLSAERVTDILDVPASACPTTPTLDRIHFKFTEQEMLVL